MNLIKLKTDSLLPHHYLIAVSMHPITAGDNAGQRFLKYGPLYFHNDDVKKYKNAIFRINDKLFKTSQREALQIEGVSELSDSIAGMLMAASANQATIHHFSSKDNIMEDDFVVLVKLANQSEHGRRLLDVSWIKNR